MPRLRTELCDGCGFRMEWPLQEPSSEPATSSSSLWPQPSRSSDRSQELRLRRWSVYWSKSQSCCRCVGSVIEPGIGSCRSNRRDEANFVFMHGQLSPEPDGRGTAAIDCQ